MAVFRVNKNSNYTTISNVHLRDKRLSLKAKGLLTVMLSLPDSWDYSAAGLVAINKEGESAIKSALKELKKYGYLTIEKVTPDKTESGQFEYIYNIFEVPNVEKDVDNSNQGGGFLPLESQPLENQDLENHTQLNTNNKITKELNTNNKGKFSTKKTEQPQFPPRTHDRCKCGANIIYNISMARFECSECFEIYNEDEINIE